MMIVCELMHKGDLHQYLLSLRPRYEFILQLPLLLLHHKLFNWHDAVFQIWYM